MARLPQPGSDSGIWGNVLNDYLSQALKPDGTLKDDAVSNTAIADGTIAEVKLDSAAQTKLNAVAGTPDWNTITNKPAVIAAGATQAAAKAVVSLDNVDNTSDVTKNAASVTLTNKTISGASNTLSNIPESAVTNLVSDLSGKAATVHTHTASQISDSTATGQSLITAASAAGARTAIGAGTASTKADVGLGNADNTSDATKNSASVTLTNKTISGADNTLSSIGISSISATGTPSNSNFLRGDGTWSGAGGSIAGVLNVRDYGATGDGTTDDSAAFLAAFNAAAAATVTTFGNDDRGATMIYIPPGTYRIANPEYVIPPNVVSPPAAGFAWKGAGRQATMLVFDPSTADSYMCNNQNDLLHLTFEDLTFYGNHPTGSFMLSDSQNQAQNYVFNRCNWDGTWKYGLNLTGVNTNSEITWFHCGIYGDWTAFLYSSASASDQFLNYSFYSCQNEVTSGDFVSLAKGGNVNVFGGSLIHIGNGTQSSSSDQCFFKLGAGVSGHSSGVQRLLVSGARVEHRHENSSLIQCSWSRGNVSFISCDTDAWTPILTSPNNVTQASFGLDNSFLPSIVFDGCTLTGKHEYTVSAGTWSSRPSVDYRSCEITTHTTAADFITMTNVGATGNVFGAPPIRFIKCRGDGSGGLENFDCTVGAFNANSVIEPKVLSMQKPYGGIVFTADPTSNANLPLNAVITRVRAWKGVSGSSTSTTFTYTLQDADSATIATATGGGAEWKDGWTYDSGLLFYRCTTTNKRTLTLTSANIDQNQSNTFFLVEYLA